MQLLENYVLHRYVSQHISTHTYVYSKGRMCLYHTIRGKRITHKCKRKYINIFLNSQKVGLDNEGNINRRTKTQKI